MKEYYFTLLHFKLQIQVWEQDTWWPDFFFKQVQLNYIISSSSLTNLTTQINV
jgi:hypothetical protein